MEPYYFKARSDITPTLEYAFEYLKRQSCIQGLTQKVGPTFYESVFGGSRFRSLLYRDPLSYACRTSKVAGLAAIPGLGPRLLQ